MAESIKYQHPPLELLEPKPGGDKEAEKRFAQIIPELVRRGMISWKDVGRTINHVAAKDTQE